MASKSTEAVTSMGLYDVAPTLRFADLEVDFAKRELRRRGSVLEIEPKVFDMLHYLLRHRSRIVRKIELLDALWPDIEVSEASLTSCVVRLRRVLGDADGRFIKTYYGKGYRFIAECKESAPVNSAAAPTPSATPTTPTFVGREEDVGRLSAALAEACSGCGSMVLIGGEQGIGKTRLLERFRESIPADQVLVAVGRSYEGDGAPPFWPWLQVLREYAAVADPRLPRSVLTANGMGIVSLAPDLAWTARGSSAGPADDGAQSRFHLFRTISTFLRRASSRKPLLILLEDVHWADTPSLLLMRSLARDLRNMRVLVVATLRDNEAHAAEILRETLADLLTAGSCQMHSLHGLDLVQVNDLVGSLVPDLQGDAFCQRLHRETNGNPFFIEQVMRHLREAGALKNVQQGEPGWERLGVPAGLQMVVERRVARLGRGCRHLLAIAAIIGREFDGTLLNRVRAAELGQSLLQSHDEMQQEIDAAVTARILDAPSLDIDRYQFTHAVLRDVVYRAQGIAERTRRHRRVAEALEAEHQAGVSVNVSEIAEHYVLGAASGSVAKAIQWATRAGDAATAQFAFEPAARRYQQALSLLSLLEDHDRACEGTLLIALSQAQWGAGEATAASETAQQAAVLAKQNADAELLARAALACGSRIVAQASPDDLFVRSLEEARAALAEEDSTLRAKLLGRLSWAYYYAPDRGERRQQLSDEALAMARRLGEPSTLAWALADRHRALMCPDNNGERLALADELIVLAEAHRWRDLLAQGYQQKAWDLLERGDTEAADNASKHVGQLARGFNNTVKWSYLLWQSMRAMLDGRWDDAQRLREETFAFGRPIDESFATLTAGTQFLTCQYVLGNLDGLTEQLRAVMASFPNLTVPRAALAAICLAQGRGDEARQEAEHCLARGIEALPWDTTWIPTVGFLAAVFAELGDRRRCEEIYGVLQPYAERVGILGVNASVCYGAVARALAVVAASLGRWQDAELHFDTAATINRRIGARPWLAYTRYEHARALIRRGRKQDAARVIVLAKEARRLASELHMLRLENASRELGR